MTAKQETKYLKKQNKFYIAGWFDGKRGDEPQHNTRAEDTNYFVDYMHGYVDGGNSSVTQN